MIWGSLIFRIGVERLDKCRDVLDCVIRSIKEIFVRYRCADEVIGSSILNILLGVFHLKVH